LRSILGGCLSVDPRLLCFRYSAYGKPALTDEFGGQTIRFNLSHSDGRALFAVTEHCEVGIDVEHIKADFATMEIAEKFFSPAEVAQLRLLPIERRPQGFFNCWTRKEAYVKARGEGLSYPLEKFDVSLAPGAAAALLRTEDEPDEVRRCMLKDLAVGYGYVGALALRFPPSAFGCLF
jgi:4'-phosphopantetheinyl transferase